jgi:hypothetical protein
MIASAAAMLKVRMIIYLSCTNARATLRTEWFDKAVQSFARRRGSAGLRPNFQ